MSIIKALTVFAIMFGLFYCSDESFAIVRAGTTSGNPTAVESSRSTENNAMSRITAPVGEINGNVLILADGRQYDLGGVKVITKVREKNATGKRIAEMLFINKQLKQVTIH